jgi:hypothetical protein
MRIRRPKEAEALQKVRDRNRQIVIQAFGLTPEERTRLDTVDVKDPLSGYAGNILVHADLIVEDRTVIPDNIILGEE